jgi:hypothetical protein
MHTRRRLLAAFIIAPLAAASPACAQSAPHIEVYKSPTCGCCNDWIDHLKASGFRVVAHDVGNNAARARIGLPARYGSCHTAVIDGYVVEGHVPAREIRRLLKERPQAIGLAVPEMPFGSPGMDGPKYGNKVDPYDVLLVLRDGTARVFQSYR